MTNAPPPEAADTLAAICASVIRLLAASPRPPARLRVDSAGHTVEIEWAAGAEAVVPDGDAQEELGRDEFHVRAPAIGTFYRAPTPEAEPFVRVGDRIVSGQQIGILEAMKLMNPIEADRAGHVLEILVSDGNPVEFGQPLLLCADNPPLPRADGGRDAARHAANGFR